MVKAKDYLRDMNISQYLIDKIWTISSKDIEWISFNELVGLIGQSAPYFSEYTISLRSKCDYLDDDEMSDMINYEVYTTIAKVSGKEHANVFFKQTNKHLISQKYHTYLKERLDKANKCVNDLLHKYRIQLANDILG